MKNDCKQIRLFRKIIAVFLALVMTAGLMQHMAVAEHVLSDGLIGTEDLRGVYRNIDSEYDEEYLMSIWHEGPFEEFEFSRHEAVYTYSGGYGCATDIQAFEAGVGTRVFQNQLMSTARQNYFLLLEGNYRSVEIPGRFEELFGYMSPDYILQNYTRIFDITSEEMDQAILRVLTQGASDVRNHTRGALSPFMEQMYSVWNLNEEEYWRESAPENPLSIDAPDICDSTPYMGDFIPIRQGIPEFPPMPELWAEHDYETTLFESEYLIADSIQGVVPFNTSEVRVSVVSFNSTSVTLDLFFNTRHNPVNNGLRYWDHTIPDPQFNGVWVPVLGQHSFGLPLATTGRHTVSGLTPGATYRFQARIWDSVRGVWVNDEVRVTLPGARTPSFQVVSVTQTSFTFDVTFPVEGNWGNRVEFRDGENWVDATGMGRNARSGRFTVNNLNPGRTYRLFFTHFDRQNERWADGYNTHITMQLPPQQLQRFAHSNITFYLDQVKIGAMGQTRANSLMAATNQGYNLIHGLAGGNRPFDGALIEFRSYRYLPWPAERQMGPGSLMRWQTSSLPGPSTSHVAIDHAHAMSRFNANTTKMPIHMVARVFNNPRWSFCDTAFAVFFTYYYYYRSGQSMSVAWAPRAFHGGNGFMDWMRSYANRHTSGASYDGSVGQGVYGPYGMAWNLANIQTQIGWEPFYQTFRYFHDLAVSQIPTANIDKLNYFLSRLQDYSGRDVFAMFNANERAVYEAHFGGVMRYIERGAAASGPSIIVTPSEWAPPPEGETATFRVSNSLGLGWSFNGVPSWITWTTQSGGILNLTAAPNTGSVTRTANINVFIRDMPEGPRQILTVTQDGQGGLSIRVTPNFWNPLYTGDSADFTVTAAQGWQFNGVPSWITWVTRPGAVTFTAAANNTNNTRTANIVFRLRDVPDSCTYVLNIVQFIDAGMYDGSVVTGSPRNMSANSGMFFYIQQQGSRYFLQGSSMQRRDLPNQQWYLRFRKGLADGSRYYEFTQENQMLAVLPGVNNTIGMAISGSLSDLNRSLWRLELENDYNYRIVNRWAYLQPNVSATIIGSSTTGATTLQTRRPTNQLWYIRNLENFNHHRAVRPYPWRVANRNFSVVLCSSVEGTAWETSIRTGITSWNTRETNRNAGVAILVLAANNHAPHVFSVTDENTLFPMRLGSVYYAQMSSGNIIQRSRSTIYAANIIRHVQGMPYAHILVHSVAEAVAAHEMGHLLGLADGPPTNGESIMHGARRQNILTAHTAFDARNVLMIFGYA